MTDLIQHHVVFLNGSNGVGKDTFAEAVAKLARDRIKYLYGTDVYTKKIDSVGFIKDMLQHAGVWNGIKDEKGRALLCDVKKAVDKYDDVSNHMVIQQVMDIIKFCSKSTPSILFIHVREPENITGLIRFFNLHYDNMKCYTVLIKMDGIKVADNPSDQNVNNFSYDFEYTEVKGSEDTTLKNAEDFIKTIFTLSNEYTPTPGKVRGIVDNCDAPSQVETEVKEAKDALVELQKENKK